MTPVVVRYLSDVLPSIDAPLLEGYALDLYHPFHLVGFSGRNSRNVVTSSLSLSVPRIPTISTNHIL